MTVLPLQRRVICAACCRVFVTKEVAGPHCCDRCMQESYESEMQVYEAEALAAGFPSLDAYIEFQQRAAEDSHAAT